MNVTLLHIAVLTAISFLLGSIPFSVLICRIFLRKDVRSINDGNPGAINTFKLGGPLLGWPVLLLDLGKGLAPVLIAQLTFGVTGLALIPIAIAPILGHAFSPFLGFKGGKAIATTFGVWGGMYSWGLFPFEGFAVFFVMNLFLDIIQSSNGWTVTLASCAVSVYMLVTRIFIIRPVSDLSTAFIVIALLNSAVIIYKHREALKVPFKLRPPGTKPFSSK